MTELPKIETMRGIQIRLLDLSDAKQRKLAHLCAQAAKLSNLMLDLQKAAYSGQDILSRLAWRPMWAQIVQDDHVEAERVYREGKITKSGRIKKEPGVGREEERETLKAKLKQMEKQKKKNTPEFKALKEQINRIAAKPEPIDPDDIEKILWRWRPNGLPLEDDMMFGLFAGIREALRGGKCDHTHRRTLAWLKKKKLGEQEDAVIGWLKEHGGECDCKAVAAAAEVARETAKTNRPGIFIDKHVLNKIMARLKGVKQTAWIKELPSHAAQKCVVDLCGAIDNMLRERGKAARGEPSRKTGFPRYKRAADGTVYFPNTTVSWNFIASRVKLPNGIGTISYDPKALRKERHAAMERHEEREYRPGAKVGMIGARIWRRGRQWYLSVQWDRSIQRLPATGRKAGVKINASVPITVYEHDRPIKTYEMPPVEPALAAAHKKACKALSRTIEDQKKREDKLTRRKRWQRQRAAEAGRIVKPVERPARVRRSRSFHEAKNEIARLEKIDQGIRDDFIHQATNDIVEIYDEIAFQQMDVAQMMNKQRQAKRDARRDRRRKRHQGKRRSPIGLKIARKMNRRAAMAKIGSVLLYKYHDLRGPDSCRKIDKHDVNASACSRCGTIHPDWQDGRKIVRCDARLPDGTTCGNELARHVNAAKLSRRELDRPRKTA